MHISPGVLHSCWPFQDETVTQNPLFQYNHKATAEYIWRNFKGGRVFFLEKASAGKWERNETFGG